MDLEATRMLATRLMATHGLADWTFAFDGAKRRAGLCRYGAKTISLSQDLTALHSEADVRDTILHEIAHALVGPKHHHDEIWRAVAVQIGCSGERCVPEGAPKIEGAWVGVRASGHRVSAHRRPERIKSCKKCSPSGFSANALFSWTHEGRAAAMHPNYLAELANLRSRANGEATAPLRLVPGQRVVLQGNNKWSGREALIHERRRTRYVIRLSDGTRLTIPFALVHEAHG